MFYDNMTSLTTNSRGKGVSPVQALDLQLVAAVIAYLMAIVIVAGYMANVNREINIHGDDGLACKKFRHTAISSWLVMTATIVTAGLLTGQWHYCGPTLFIFGSLLWAVLFWVLIGATAVFGYSIYRQWTVAILWPIFGIGWFIRWVAQFLYYLGETG